MFATARDEEGNGVDNDITGEAAIMDRNDDHGHASCSTESVHSLCMEAKALFEPFVKTLEAKVNAAYKSRNSRKEDCAGDYCRRQPEGHE